MKTEPTKFEDYILRRRKLGKYAEIETPKEPDIPKLSESERREKEFFDMMRSAEEYRIKQITRPLDIMIFLLSIIIALSLVKIVMLIIKLWG
jgi:hypothetical protein